jgi:hypothetical protein
MEDEIHLTGGNCKMMDWHDTRYMDLSMYLAEDVQVPQLRNPMVGAIRPMGSLLGRLFGKKRA